MFAFKSSSVSLESEICR